MSIYVTKTFLPPYEEYCRLLTKIWDTSVVTNQGPYVHELEQKIQKLLNLEHFQYVGNGTVALQLALSALDIHDGEIITTPFSYVATTGSILWERCTPVFADIEPDNFTIDTTGIEGLLTPETRAILAVHVFGYACNTEEIEKIAKRHNLKVIYDGAHAFASKYNGKSLLSFGDITTCSFHATKLFHTVEGGACITKDRAIADVIDLQKRFGQKKEEQLMLGINAKQSEFHAAMGLVNLNYLSQNIAARKHICELYDSLLDGILGRPAEQKNLEYNYAYYPVLFKSEKDLLGTFELLNKHDIYPRRYFHPSLNTLPYLKTRCSCPISEDICSRIACLPLYTGLKDEEVKKICSLINQYHSKK